MAIAEEMPIMKSSTSPRSERKQREYEARRDEILSAAEGLFSKNGFFKTSMAEIAVAAQFAMGTLYKFFKSKEDIYISLVESKVEEMLQQLEQAVRNRQRAEDKIREVIRVKLAFADQNRDFFHSPAISRHKWLNSTYRVEPGRYPSDSRFGIPPL